MRSSYIKNSYDEVFYAIATTYRPVIAVELGILDGYSAISIAKGLKRNKETIGLDCHLDAYDLFEDYQYNKANQVDVQKTVDDSGLKEFISLKKEDAFEVHKYYQDNTVYFLHVDLSNDGEIVRKIIELWDKKLVIGGIILFEGGSEERDNVKWMIEYNKKPIKYELENNSIIKEKYIFGTYLKFPSLTVLLKKR